jgi:hypothetical protein
MNLKIRLFLNVLLNIFLLSLIITMTYSWMLTQKSEGQLVDYNRDFLITDSDIDVEVYAYINNQYVEQTTSPIFLELLEPGAIQRYRFDITNNQDELATVKVVMANITGDVAVLRNFLYIGGTTPLVFYYSINDRLLYDEVSEKYFLDMIDRVEIPGSETVSVYVYIKMSEETTNEAQDKEITISKFVFTKS